MAAQVLMERGWKRSCQCMCVWGGANSGEVFVRKLLMLAQTLSNEM